MGTTSLRGGGYKRRGCCAKCGNVSVANNTTVKLPINDSTSESILYDDSMLDGVNNQIVIPIGGRYLLSGMVRFLAHTAGSRMAYLYVNGSRYAGESRTASQTSYWYLYEMLCISTLAQLNQNDTVAVYCRHNIGAAWTAQGVLSVQEVP